MDAIKAMRLGRMAWEVNTDGEESGGLSWGVLRSQEVGKSMEVPLISTPPLNYRCREERWLAEVGSRGRKKCNLKQHISEYSLFSAQENKPLEYTKRKKRRKREKLQMP